MGKPIIDLTGQKIGYWTVLSRAQNNKRSHTQWLCRCACGTEKVIVGIVLRDRRSRSCGCLHRETTTARNTKHGHSSRGQISPTYRTWTDMIRRCADPNSKSYPYYGALGITVCDRWLDFESFLSDMGERPAGLTIDRINTNGNYEPGNCRWATRTTQTRNRNLTVTATLDGKTQTLAEWSEQTGINYITLTMRLRRGWSIERTLTHKLQRYSRSPR